MPVNIRHKQLEVLSNGHFKNSIGQEMKLNRQVPDACTHKATKSKHLQKGVPRQQQAVICLPVL